MATPADKPPDILRFFSAKHLQEPLKSVSQPFCDLAQKVFEVCPNNAERSVALRKLLESKDAAVRAVLPE